MSDVEVHADIKAPATRIWSLVSDITRMGEWSPENRGGRWLGSASGPQHGARFKGSNAKGLRRWTTTCTVTDATTGKRFAFDVDYAGIPIATWEYDFAESSGNTHVTESFTDRRPSWMKVASGPVMGVWNRNDYNRAGMEHTLAALKRAAES